MSEPALKAVSLAPKQKPPQIDPAKEFLLLTPTAQMAFFAFSSIDFGGAIIRAAAALHGGEHALLFDACKRFHVEGTDTSGAQHGTRTRGCTDFSFRHCKSHNNTIEGFINGGSHDGLLEDCDSYENGTDAKGHAFYLASYGSTNIVGRRLRAWKCKGTAWQLNGTPDELGPRKQKNITLEDSEAWECGSQGTPAINAMSTDGFTIKNVLIRNCNAGIALFDDYTQGADPWNVSIVNLTLYLPTGKYGIQVSKGTKNLTIANSIHACKPGPVKQVVEARQIFGSGIIGKPMWRLVPVKEAEEIVGAAPTESGVVRWFGAGGEPWDSVSQVLELPACRSVLPGVGWSASPHPDTPPPTPTGMFVLEAGVRDGAGKVYGKVLVKFPDGVVLKDGSVVRADVLGPDGKMVVRGDGLVEF